MGEERKLWLKAVEEFRNNIDAVVHCPKCKNGMLTIIDIAFDEKDISKGGERIVECQNCRKFEIVLYRIPPINWYHKKIDNI